MHCTAHEPASRNRCGDKVSKIIIKLIRRQAATGKWWQHTHAHTQNDNLIFQSLQIQLNIPVCIWPIIRIHNVSFVRHPSIYVDIENSCGFASAGGCVRNPHSHQPQVHCGDMKTWSTHVRLHIHGVTAYRRKKMKTVTPPLIEDTKYWIIALFVAILKSKSQRQTIFWQYHKYRTYPIAYIKNIVIGLNFVLIC